MFCSMCRIAWFFFFFSKLFCHTLITVPAYFNEFILHFCYKIGQLFIMFTEGELRYEMIRAKPAEHLSLHVRYGTRRSDFSWFWTSDNEDKPVVWLGFFLFVSLPTLQSSLQFIWKRFIFLSLSQMSESSFLPEVALCQRLANLPFCDQHIVTSVVVATA